jgi:hypothetical protein
MRRAMQAPCASCSPRLFPRLVKETEDGVGVAAVAATSQPEAASWRTLKQ